MKERFNKLAKAMRVISFATVAALSIPLAASAQEIRTQPPYNPSLSHEFNVMASGQYRLPDLASSPAIRAHNIIVIRRGYGGEMNTVLNRYENWINQGYRIIVDGRVTSADAFGAFNENYQGRVCYTNRAVFSPHAARYENGTEVLPEITDRLARSLVPALEWEFRASPFYNRWQGSAYIDADRLREIYPQGECSPQLQRMAKEARPARLVIRPGA